MDDMVIFGSNKRKLHKIKDDIQNYLNNKLGIRLKENWQVFRFDYKKKGKHYGRCLDYMGFKFYRNKTILRKHIMLKASRKARKIHKKLKPTSYDARQMLSYIGWIDSTNTYNMYIKWIKPYVNIKQLKITLSIYDKKHNINYSHINKSKRKEFILNEQNISRVPMRW